MGVCLGAQLIAKALGARVYKNPAEEIGWAPIYFTDAAKDDPVFGVLLRHPTTFSTGMEKRSICRRAPIGWRIPISLSIRLSVTEQMFTASNFIRKFNRK